MKYLLRKCEIFASRMWANFISHCDRREQYFTISARKLFHIRRKPNISLNHRGLAIGAVFGSVAGFEPAKAFLREEGGTRSVTEGACATLKSDETLRQRALPQSPAASRRRQLPPGGSLWTCTTLGVWALPKGAESN